MDMDRASDLVNYDRASYLFISDRSRIGRWNGLNRDINLRDGDNLRDWPVGNMFVARPDDNTLRNGRDYDEAHAKQQKLLTIYQNYLSE